MKSSIERPIKDNQLPEHDDHAESFEHETQAETIFDTSYDIIMESLEEGYQNRRTANNKLPETWTEDYLQQMDKYADRSIMPMLTQILGKNKDGSIAHTTTEGVQTLISKAQNKFEERRMSIINDDPVGKATNSKEVSKETFVRLVDNQNGFLTAMKSIQENKAAGNVKDGAIFAFMNYLLSKESFYANNEYSALTSRDMTQTQERYDSVRETYLEAVKKIKSDLPVPSEDAFNPGWFQTRLPDGPVTQRVYITAKTDASPEVILGWHATLKKHGIEKDICYKFNEEYDPTRSDTIVVYLSAKTDKQKINAALKDFSDEFATILDKNGMPTAYTLADGVARAPEPYALSSMRKAFGQNPEDSYNEFVANMFKLSMCSVYGFRKFISGQAPASIEDIKASAKKLFPQLLRLSKIDPDTLLPINN